jgi:hypothetical protein
MESRIATAAPVKSTDVQIARPCRSQLYQYHFCDCQHSRGDELLAFAYNSLCRHGHWICPDLMAFLSRNLISLHMVW